MAFSVEAIEKKIDQAAAGAVAVSNEVGGIAFSSMMDVMEFSKLMATAGTAIPEHLRGNPGACLAVCVQALEWRMSPFAVANKSYVANDRVAYESQLIHALVEARAPLKARLRHEIIGEDDERRCKVWGTFKGETEAHVYISETLKTLREARGRNQYGNVKGSPLWVQQPETQLFYSATRTWARMFCPDVILGIYAPDELPDEPKDVTPPKLTKSQEMALRLKERKHRHAQPTGFRSDHVTTEVGKATGSVIEEKRNGEEGEGVGRPTGVQDGERDTGGDDDGPADYADGVDQPDQSTGEVGSGAADAKGTKEKVSKRKRGGEAEEGQD